MMQKIISILADHIEYVTGGFSLLAFVVTAGVLIAKFILDYRKSALENSKGKTRVEILERLSDYFNIDTSKLTNQQKYMLIMEQIKIKRHKLNLNVFMFCFASVIFGGVAFYTIEKEKTPDPIDSKTTQEKVEPFPFLNRPPLALATVSVAQVSVAKPNENDGKAKSDAGSSAKPVDEVAPAESKNKKVFEVPAGTLKKNVSVDGTWDTVDGKSVFKYQQDFMGAEFNSSVVFDSGVAKKSKLILDKTYNEYNWDNNGTLRNDKTGNSGIPPRYCFGERYKEFISEIVSKYGDATGKPKITSEDISSDLPNLSGNCGQIHSASCNNQGNFKKIVYEFKDDSGTNILIFTAKNTVWYRDYTLWERSGLHNYNNCEWTLELK